MKTSQQSPPATLCFLEVYGVLIASQTPGIKFITNLFSVSCSGTGQQFFVRPESLNLDLFVFGVLNPQKQED